MESSVFPSPPPPPPPPPSPPADASTSLELPLAPDFPSFMDSTDGDISFPTPPALSLEVTESLPNPPLDPPLADDDIPLGSSEHKDLSRTSSGSGSGNTEEDSGDENIDFDFTDADLAIDRMLDDLNDFQMVGNN